MQHVITDNRELDMLGEIVNEVYRSKYMRWVHCDKLSDDSKS